MTKIKSKRELALKLSDKNEVEETNVSKSLKKVVELWISYGDIIRKGNKLIGNY